MCVGLYGARVRVRVRARVLAGVAENRIRAGKDGRPGRRAASVLVEVPGQVEDNHRSSQGIKVRYEVFVE